MSSLQCKMLKEMGGNDMRIFITSTIIIKTNNVFPLNPRHFKDKKSHVPISTTVA